MIGVNSHSFNVPIEDVLEFTKKLSVIEQQTAKLAKVIPDLQNYRPSQEAIKLQQYAAEELNNGNIEEAVMILNQMSELETVLLYLKNHSPEKALEFAKSLEDEEVASVALLKIGEYYLEKNDIKLAKEIAEEIPDGEISQSLFIAIHVEEQEREELERALEL